MIKIDRPKSIPSVLVNKGLPETENNKVKYINSSAEYISGRSNFDIKSTIYNGTDVKKDLKDAQYKKCCFCEKPQGDEYGAVEHYRPKGGYMIYRGDKLKTPGYYWLGYEWDNLLFVCSTCNTKKGNIFPLVTETDRAKEHTVSIDREKPYLLNPTGKEDPRKHIVFDKQLIRGITNEGRETVEICMLDRDSLNEERRKIIDEIDERILIVLDNKDQNAVIRAKNYLRNSVLPSAPFSAMAQDYISSTWSIDLTVL